MITPELMCGSIDLTILVIFCQLLYACPSDILKKHTRKVHLMVINRYMY